jgi:hypothetical protein
MGTKIALITIYIVVVLCIAAGINYYTSPDFFLKSKHIFDNKISFYLSLTAFFGLVTYLQIQYKKRNIKGF